MNDEQLTERYLAYRRKIQEIDAGYDPGPDITAAVLARCQNDSQKALKWIISHGLTEQCIEGRCIPLK